MLLIIIWGFFENIYYARILVLLEKSVNLGEFLKLINIEIRTNFLKYVKIL
jgi:hypothetical protein